MIALPTLAQLTRIQDARFVRIREQATAAPADAQRIIRRAAHTEDRREALLLEFGFPLRNR